jgi:hypothetical protein
MNLTTFLIAIMLFMTSESGCATKRNYITGNAFRNCADYNIEGTTCSFNPETVAAGSIIYIEVDYVDYFFNHVFPRIQHPIILISHNGDMPAPGAYKSYLDDSRIIRWFGQNCDIPLHPKFHPIPIGLANAKWKHGNTHIFDTALDSLSASKDLKQAPKLYVNISPHTNPVRKKLYHSLKKQSFVTLAPRKELAPYLTEMAQHRYTLSPFGNGLDCHRTWEALLVGSIPVVKTSTLDPLYEGLPVIILQYWNEISPASLEKKYNEMRAKTYALEKLFMDYWSSLIQNCKQAFLEKITRPEEFSHV